MVFAFFLFIVGYMILTGATITFGINSTIDTIQIPEIPILGYFTIAIGVTWLMPRWIPVKIVKLFRPAWRRLSKRFDKRKYASNNKSES